MKVEEVIIVGAGPAGLTAAIQLKRYGIHPVILERAEMGGLLLNANLVENYPGFPRGIRGPELVQLFIHQTQNLGIQVAIDEVVSVDFEQGLFQVVTHQTNYASKVVVVATGTRPLRLTDISIPDELADRIFYEVYPLLGVEGKRVVILGSGDAAFDYALNLSKKNQVTILMRGATHKCLPLLWERVQKVPGITYHTQAMVSKLVKSPQGGMLIDCQSPAGGLQLYADYLVGAVGRQAQLDCLSASLCQLIPELEQRGILYIIGDVKNGIYRQTSIAVGEGVLAAMKIYRHLKEQP
ncbi:MAG TPA: NAD(P)/FAD-dependent oxidoreductase [Anaerolineales bacterium]|nr:NAD(P)/FAD-dependent oxidoreductase [Anaerolineales bacterium]